MSRRWPARSTPSREFVANFFYDPENFLLMQIIFGDLLITALFIHRLHRFGDNAAAWVLTIWFVCGVSSSSIFYGLQAQAQVYFVLAAIIWLVFGLEHWRQALAAGCSWLHGDVPGDRLRAAAGHRDHRRPARDQIPGRLQSIINAILINAAVLFYALFLLYRAEDELERQVSPRRRAGLGGASRSGGRRLRADPRSAIADRIDDV